QRTSSVDPGFDTHNLYMMSIDPLRDGYPADAAETFLAKVRERVKRTPGVIDASLSYYAPAGTRASASVVRTKSDFNSLQQALQTIQVEPVGLGYFETTGIQILRGRGFIERDAGEHKIIVNATMAKQTWADQDPLGRDLELNGKHYEVIGVAHDLNGGGVFD